MSTAFDLYMGIDGILSYGGPKIPGLPILGDPSALKRAMGPELARSSEIERAILAGKAGTIKKVAQGSAVGDSVIAAQTLDPKNNQQKSATLLADKKVRAKDYPVTQQKLKSPQDKPSQQPLLAGVLDTRQISLPVEARRMISGTETPFESMYSGPMAPSLLEKVRSIWRVIGEGFMRIIHCLAETVASVWRIL